MKREIEIKGVKHLIRYRHSQDMKPLSDDIFPMVVEGKFNDRLVKGYTVAYLYVKETSEIIEEAYAYCSLQDNFSKHLGRRIAYGRLMLKFN